MTKRDPGLDHDLVRRSAEYELGFLNVEVAATDAVTWDPETEHYIVMVPIYVDPKYVTNSEEE